MYREIGEGIAQLITLLALIVIISVPLAIWKLVEIIIWLFNHIKVVIQ